MLWIGRVTNGRIDYANSEDQRKGALLRLKGE
jgi:hypothetical protein